ncbi:MAG: PleD family two-component system response regulator [Alphaproteobacteria bacterium]|nr:PleD family two-component system response regulator [Alphaproteobacteria bacterium]
MSARILVVDDTPLNLKVLEAKLARDYYFVTTASSGPQALEIAQAQRPDLILLDVMMPDMDGFEVCERLKANAVIKHIPVVMVTALSDVKDRVHGLESGADDFLTKPINETALLARVRSLLRLKLMMDEWRMREETATRFALPFEEGTDENDKGGKILLLEDDSYSAEHLQKDLTAMGCSVTAVESIDKALDHVAQDAYDLVMISLDLRDEDGLRLCANLRAAENTRTLPILLMSQDTDMERVARGLDLGANDYIMRPIETAELSARTRTQLRQKRYYDRLHRNYEHHLSLALVDPLTGAYNRRYLDMHFPAIFARSKNETRPLSVLSLDLDHFKSVNDRFGHAAGDVVLKEVISRVKQSLRPADLVVRMGGEEFAILTPDTPLATALNVAERLRLAIATKPIEIEGQAEPLPITASFGVASLNHESDKDPALLLERADMAVYHAKQAGRNCTKS